MTNEEIIRELKSVEERYRNKPVPTFEVNISSMARSYRQHIEQLAKENEELKEFAENIVKASADNPDEFFELKKENEELKERLIILEKRINTLKIKNASLERKNEEQKAQVERMKCCGNCKWYIVENGGETFCDCVGDCIDFDKWKFKDENRV